MMNAHPVAVQILRALGGHRVQGSQRFGLQGLGVSCLGFGSGFWASGFRVWALELGFGASGCGGLGV